MGCLFHLHFDARASCFKDDCVIYKSVVRRNVRQITRKQGCLSGTYLHTLSANLCPCCIYIIYKKGVGCLFHLHFDACASCFKVNLIIFVIYKLVVFWNAFQIIYINHIRIFRNLNAFSRNLFPCCIHIIYKKGVGFFFYLYQNNIILVDSIPIFILDYLISTRNIYAFIRLDHC